MDRTDSGYDVFHYYLGKVNRLMDRPWGKKERHPSWGIYKYEDVWLWKDQATEESGNCFDFVMKMFSVTLPEARVKISKDLGLTTSVIIKPEVLARRQEAEDDDREYVPINFSYKPFEKAHHEFWNIAGVSEEHCRKYECYAVKDLAINRKRAYISPDEIVFAYYAPEIDRVKIYFPNREKGERFRNNVPGKYLWNYNHVSECKNLVVQKSNKDLIVTTVFTPCCISTQSESASIFTEELADKITALGREIYISYGSDKDGKEKSIKITGEHGWKWCNPPNEYLPEVNDFYSMAKKYGPAEVEKLLKSKNII